MRKSVYLLAAAAAVIACTAAKAACGSAVPTTSGAVASVPATPDDGGVSTAGPKIPRYPLPFKSGHVGIGKTCTVTGWDIRHPKGATEITGAVTIACAVPPSTIHLGLRLRRKTGGRFVTQMKGITTVIPTSAGKTYTFGTACHAGTWMLDGVVIIDVTYSAYFHSTPVFIGKCGAGSYP
jgi:hypothetical protein